MNYYEKYLKYKKKYLNLCQFGGTTPSTDCKDKHIQGVHTFKDLKKKIEDILPININRNLYNDIDNYMKTKSSTDKEKEMIRTLARTNKNIIFFNEGEKVPSCAKLVNREETNKIVETKKAAEIKARQEKQIAHETLYKAWVAANATAREANATAREAKASAYEAATDEANRLSNIADTAAAAAAAAGRVIKAIIDEFNPHAYIDDIDAINKTIDENKNIANDALTQANDALTQAKTAANLIKEIVRREELRPKCDARRITRSKLLHIATDAEKILDIECENNNISTLKK